MQDSPLLVVSDVDGTLLNSRERVSQRMRRAVSSMLRQGTVFTIATGRPPRWLMPVFEQLPVRPICACANGAIIYDANRDQILHAATLAPGPIRALIDQLSESVPGVGFAVERAGTSAFDRADELFSVSPGYDHAWDSTEHVVQTIDELTATPVVKLLVRDPHRTSAELYAAVRPFIDATQAKATYSYEGGLVEIAAAGISKRSALEWIAAQIGVDANQTVAFGDMPNDTEMLTWAGLGVAMGNAEESLKGIADEVTLTNDEDGVAAVLERWF